MEVEGRLAFLSQLSDRVETVGCQVVAQGPTWQHWNLVVGHLEI